MPQIAITTAIFTTATKHLVMAKTPAAHPNNGLYGGRLALGSTGARENICGAVTSGSQVTMGGHRQPVQVRQRLVQGQNGQPGPADGSAAPTSPLFRTTATVTARIGGVNAPVTFSGLTPTLAGLYQVNIQVPSGVTAGNTVTLAVIATDPNTGASAQSNSVIIAVQ